MAATRRQTNDLLLGIEQMLESFTLTLHKQWMRMHPQKKKKSSLGVSQPKVTGPIVSRLSVRLSVTLFILALRVGVWLKVVPSCS